MSTINSAIRSSVNYSEKAYITNLYKYLCAGKKHSVPIFYTETRFPREQVFKKCGDLVRRNRAGMCCISLSGIGFFYTFGSTLLGFRITGRLDVSFSGRSVDDDSLSAASKIYDLYYLILSNAAAISVMVASKISWKNSLC